MRLTIVNQFYPPDLSPTAHLAASLAEHRAALGDEVTVITGRAGYVPTAPIRPTGDRSGRNAPPSVTGSPADRTGDRSGRSAPPSVTSSPGGRVRVVRLWTPGGGKASVTTRLTGYAAFLAGAAVRMATLPRQDVVVALTTPPYVVTTALLHRAIRRGTHIVLWSMDCYPDAAERFGQLDPAGWPSRALRAVNRWLYPRVDHLVCLDGAMAELLRSQYARPGRPPITVIPNWEPAALFPPSPRPDAPADPGRTSWPGYVEAGVADRFRLVYTGNAGYGHRFDTVAAAMARLDSDRHALVAIGGGIRWPELEAARDTSRTAGGAPVVLHGYVPKEDMPAVLAGAGAALICLDDAALGVMSPSKLHAALGSGRPVVYVGPEGSNVDEAIARFGCGVSLRNGDVDGLVAAIRRLADDDAWRVELGRGARRAFTEAYCDERTLPAWDAVIDD